MSRRILVPIDGSPFSERALTLAVPLAQQHEASLVLTLVHAVPPVVEGLPVAAAGGALDGSTVREHLRAQLERVARRVATRDGVTTATQFREGPVLDEIEAAVADVSASLVVMATHGRGGVSRLWLGSVADSLLRRCTVPVLVTRTARKWTLTTATEPFFPRVLVALDGSPLAEQALEQAISLLGESTGEFLLVRVEDAPIAAVSSTWISEATLRMREGYLEPLAERYRTPNRTIRTRGVVHHDAARAILDVAKEEHAFAIALATNGRSGVRRAVIGSVADKVIRGASVPVLVCPPSGGAARGG
jgi:nucleotide-binding universal stress UspA family protein